MGANQTEMKKNYPPEGSCLHRGSALGNMQKGRETEKTGMIQTQNTGRGVGSTGGTALI